MSVTLRRQASTEDVSLEVQSGIDGQGKPIYDSPVTVVAHVVRQVEDLRDIQTRSGLASIRAIATMWVDTCDNAVLPAIDDRLTTADGELVGIVIFKEECRTLARGLDHVIVKIREE